MPAKRPEKQIHNYDSVKQNGRKMLNTSRPSGNPEMYQAFSAINFSSFSWASALPLYFAATFW